jgi:hypothetical protein
MSHDTGSFCMVELQLWPYICVRLASDARGEMDIDLHLPCYPNAGTSGGRWCCEQCGAGPDRQPFGSLRGAEVGARMCEGICERVRVAHLMLEVVLPDLKHLLIMTAQLAVQECSKDCLQMLRLHGNGGVNNSAKHLKQCCGFMYVGISRCQVHDSDALPQQCTCTCFYPLHTGQYLGARYLHQKRRHGWPLSLS